jgi:hypothetical protein
MQASIFVQNYIYETGVKLEQSGRDFHHIINKINNNYELDVINAARDYKKCFNSAQYEQPEKAEYMEELREFYRIYGSVTEENEADNQQEAGTAAETASEGRETAPGTLEAIPFITRLLTRRGRRASPSVTLASPVRGNVRSSWQWTKWPRRTDFAKVHISNEGDRFVS